MEKSPEIASGHNTSYFRELDARTGKWWSTDPVTFPHQSPYSTFDNNPVALSDPSGAATGNGAGTGSGSLNGYRTPTPSNTLKSVEFARSEIQRIGEAKVAQAINKPDTFDNGKYLWELSDYERGAIENEANGKGYLNEVPLSQMGLEGFTWTWSERLYYLGHMFGFSLPTAKLKVPKVAPKAAPKPPSTSKIPSAPAQSLTKTWDKLVLKPEKMLNGDTYGQIIVDGKNVGEFNYNLLDEVLDLTFKVPDNLKQQGIATEAYAQIFKKFSVKKVDALYTDDNYKVFHDAYKASKGGNVGVIKALEGTPSGKIVTQHGYKVTGYEIDEVGKSVSVTWEK